jgi:hypothetical protein
MTDTL